MVKSRLKIEVHPRQGNGEVPTDAELVEALGRSGWNDDPGFGKAVLLPDGSELVSPLPHALPLGYVKEKSITELIDERLRAHRAMLEDAMEIDSKEDMNDFEVAEEIDAFSFYEFEGMQDDAPGLDPAEAKPPPEILRPLKEDIPNEDNKDDKKEKGAG